MGEIFKSIAGAGDHFCNLWLSWPTQVAQLPPWVFEKKYYLIWKISFRMKRKWWVAAFKFINTFSEKLFWLQLWVHLTANHTGLYPFLGVEGVKKKLPALFVLSNLDDLWFPAFKFRLNWVIVAFSLDLWDWHYLYFYSFSQLFDRPLYCL